MKMPRVELHPATLKHIKKGHPWVTLDSFSAKFPRDPLLIGLNHKGEDQALLLGDPSHPSIKARAWSLKVPIDQEIHNFNIVFRERIEKSIAKRIKQGLFSKRDNLYLCFGEADFMPGLFIQKLGHNILIQYYCSFWEKKEILLVKNLTKTLSNFFPKSYFFFWGQRRHSSTEGQTYSIGKKKNQHFSIEEFGVKYQIRMEEGYDKGIYTDMTSIRLKLKEDIKSSDSLLNLYSYTGAYSLFALSLGLKNVTSIDLSAKYMDWLIENISLNEDLNNEQHEAIVGPVHENLKQLLKDNRSFDFIVCDPPSSSSDGKKVSNNFSKYEKDLPLICKLLSTNGKAALFVNTHQVTKKKFKDKIEKILLSSKLQKNFKITKEFSLSEDCPTLASFPEGNYLKGLLLEKIQ